MNLFVGNLIILYKNINIILIKLLFFFKEVFENWNSS